MAKDMVRAIGKRLPTRLRHALANFGFDVAPDRIAYLTYHFACAPNMQHGLEFMRSRGLDARRILDVGAYEGEWTRMAKGVWPSAELTMVEANPDKFDRLGRVADEVGGRLLTALLGARSGDAVTFHVMESGSSVYEEHSPLERSQRSMTTRSLDDLLEGDDVFDLIKIDVQGYELEVLKGAQHTLRNARALLIELSLIEINEGAPLLHEALSFMAERGFVAYDILEHHRRPLDQAMNQVDVMFVPADSPLRRDKRHYGTEKQAR